MILRCFPLMYTVEATQGNALFSRITSSFLITKLRLDEELEITLFIKIIELSPNQNSSHGSNFTNKTNNA